MDDFLLKVIPKLVEYGGIAVIAILSNTVLGYLLYLQLQLNSAIQEKRADERALNVAALEKVTMALLEQASVNDKLVASTATMIEQNRHTRDEFIRFIATVQAQRQ